MLMKKIKVADATALQLDWMVAKIKGLDVFIPAWAEKAWLQLRGNADTFCPRWSTDWAQGGPIIEREKITLSDCEGGWVAGLRGTLNNFGPTTLIAAMRCYVASKLGDEVEVPAELDGNISS